MDAETRHTLAATVPSTLVRVSFVFLALRDYDSRKRRFRTKKNEEKNERDERGGGGEREKSNRFLSLLISVKRNGSRNIWKNN